MFRTITTTAKELLLLRRDRAGLMILFVMPALLVIVITLVQENVMELTGQKKTEALLLDLDGSELGRLLRQQLQSGHIELVEWDKQQKNITDVQAAVTNGDYQVGIIIPAGTTSQMKKETALLFANSKHSVQGQPRPPIPVQVFFDPGIMPGLRSGLTAQLQMVLLALAMEEKMLNLDQQLKSLLTDPRIAPALLAPLPATRLPELIGQPLFILEEDNNVKTAETPAFNPVQQNVPAWALFGMFFTVLPLAGAILQERKSGIWIRLASLPVSHLHHFAGKVIAYTGICLCQFLLISLIGFFLFPALGLPPFTVAPSALGTVLLLVVCSGLAAGGFGLFLGMACSSYEQASTVGSTAVVAAAAIGGVMVPVYAMPQAMQRLSIISPLNWSLTAFQDLLVRGHSLTAVWDDLGRLILFFLLTTILAWKLARPQ